MKLNYKRIILVGFAFFLISAFWQAYDAIVPLMLVNKFGMNQTWSGFIMALDNILALFMLPLFGALSDKKETKYGKRTPFIFIGTLCAVVCFIGLTFVDNVQLQKITVQHEDFFWSENFELGNSEYSTTANRLTVTGADGKGEALNGYSVKDYAARVMYNKNFEELTDAEKGVAENWFIKELSNTDRTFAYVYTKPSEGGTAPYGTYKLYEKLAERTEGEVTYAAGYYEYGNDTAPIEKGAFTTNAYLSLINESRSVYAQSATANNWYILLIFIVLLLGTLIAMAVFRSPAVALMPDVTIKPLRSKANAVINLMGTAGGILVLGLGMLFGTGQYFNQIMSYTGFVCAVCAIMVVALVIFLFTVKERRWNAEMLEKQAEMDADDPETQKAEAALAEAVKNGAEIKPPEEKLSKEKLTSLILILSSVALWFIGYNAITSKYSLYAVNKLHQDYNATLMIAQVAAVIAYIPVGMLASKIGRKKTILIGIGLLTAAFTGAAFVTAKTPGWLLWMLFALAGIAWATINVNSFPMVVELSQGGNIGKFTGYYYTASMAAQIVTPIFSGFLMDALGMDILFVYGAVFVAMSFVTMLFVKYGDSIPKAPKDKLEMIGGGDD